MIEYQHVKNQTSGVNNRKIVNTKSTIAATMQELSTRQTVTKKTIMKSWRHVDDVTGLQPEAFQRLITTYFDTGVADDSLYVYQPLGFQPRISLIMPARVLVAAMVILPALLLMGVVLVMRRIRRRRTIKKSNGLEADRSEDMESQRSQS